MIVLKMVFKIADGGSDGPVEVAIAAEPNNIRTPLSPLELGHGVGRSVGETYHSGPTGHVAWPPSF